MRRMLQSVSTVLLLGVLAACGAQTNAPATPAAAEPTAAPTSAPTAAPTAAPTEAAPVEPTAASAATSFPLTIPHALGETVIPALPERVVVLEWSYSEYVLALGVQPVGVADIKGYEGWVNIPIKFDSTVVDVGTRQEPNLELIATLKPDLIITAASRAANNYESLSTIAPTLAFNAYPTDITQYEAMRNIFLTVAQVLGRDAEGLAVLAHMEATFAAVAERITAAGRTGESFALAQAYTSDGNATVRLFTENAMAVEIVSQLGLTPAWKDGMQQYGFSTVTVEELPKLGDTNFFYVVSEDDNVFASDAIKPFWESLSFVKSGHAYPLGSGTWLFGGPLSAETLVGIIADSLGV